MTVEPGLYEGVRFEEYLRWDAVDQTTLKLHKRSGAHAYEMIRHPMEPTDAMNLSQAMHVAVLEPKRFFDTYIARPDGLDRRTKEGKLAWRKITEGFPAENILDVEDFESIRGVMKKAWDHPRIGKILSGAGKNEVSFAWVDKRTGMLCKGRLDRACQQWGRSCVVDFKFMRDASYFRFRSDVAKFGYHFQAAFYLDGLVEVLGDHERTFVLSAHEKTRPYECAPYILDDDSLEQGRQEYRECLTLHKAALDSGVWPGYSADAMTMRLPDYAIRMEEWT